MVRIILAVVVGFIVWSILWVGSDQVLRGASKEYGAHQYALEMAIDNGTPFAADNSIMLIGIARSIIFSLMAGFLAAFIANENRKTTLILGVLILLIGLLVQGMLWNYYPVWYHAVFLILLIPMIVIGGRLRSKV